MSDIKIMVLVSGSGSNLAALHAASLAGNLGRAKIALVVSDCAASYALQRAKDFSIPACIEEPNKNLPKKERRKELSARILCLAKNHNIDIIVLAGFLSILTAEIISFYPRKIINLHPSLLPKFGGEGMYGSRIHEAVLQAREKETGCTVHFVDEGIDTGPILLQRKIPVLPHDTADSLAKRVHEQEHIAIVDAVKMLAG